MLNTFQDDECCNTFLIAYLGEHEAAMQNVSSWVCPKCGCIWKAQLIDGIKHWSPVPMIEVLRV